MEAFGAIIGEYKGKSKGKRTRWTVPWSSVQFLFFDKTVRVSECFLDFLTCQVTAVLADAWENFRGDPAFEVFSYGLFRAKYEGVETTFVDDD